MEAVWHAICQGVRGFFRFTGGRSGQAARAPHATRHSPRGPLGVPTGALCGFVTAEWTHRLVKDLRNALLGDAVQESTSSINCLAKARRVTHERGE